MDQAEAQLIYQQRYETYRHLDRLRWQMFQIAVATGSIALAFGKSDQSAPNWWVLAAVGILFASFGAVMERIRHGIAKNGNVLQTAAKQIGDQGIPDPAPWTTNVSFWIATSLILLGALCLALSVARACSAE